MTPALFFMGAQHGGTPAGASPAASGSQRASKSGTYPCFTKQGYVPDFFVPGFLLLQLSWLIRVSLTLKTLRR